MKRYKYPAQFMEALQLVAETVDKDLARAAGAGHKYIEFDFSVVKDDTSGATLSLVKTFLLMRGYEIGLDDSAPKILYVFVQPAPAPVARA